MSEQVESLKAAEKIVRKALGKNALTPEMVYAGLHHAAVSLAEAIAALEACQQELDSKSEQLDTVLNEILDAPSDCMERLVEARRKLETCQQERKALQRVLNKIGYPDAAINVMLNLLNTEGSE